MDGGVRRGGGDEGAAADQECDESDEVAAVRGRRAVATPDVCHPDGEPDQYGTEAESETATEVERQFRHHRVRVQEPPATPTPAAGPRPGRMAWNTLPRRRATMAAAATVPNSATATSPHAIRLGTKADSSASTKPESPTSCSGIHPSNRPALEDMIRRISQWNKNLASRYHERAGVGTALVRRVTGSTYTVNASPFAFASTTQTWRCRSMASIWAS